MERDDCGGNYCISLGEQGATKRILHLARSLVTAESPVGRAEPGDRLIMTHNLDISQHSLAVSSYIELTKKIHSLN